METNRRHPSDLTDAEWEWLEPQAPPPARRGRPLKYSRRMIFNAIFYIARSGCAWRMLPKDFAPWQIIYIAALRLMLRRLANA